MPRPAAWSEEEQRQVAGLLSIGLSYVAIARELHVTKSTVSGRINRQPELHVYVGRVKPPLPKRPVLLLQCVEVAGVPLIELARHQCKWPVAESVAGHLFCGRPRLGEWTPYCADHYRRARP